MLPLQEYESKKRKELSLYSNEWEYVRCSDRGKGKHVIKCVYCGGEKKINSLRDIRPCVACVIANKREEKEKKKYKECTICGLQFKAKRATALYCSKRCSQVAKTERHIERVRNKRKLLKRLREARAKQNGKIDYSITLARLIERDKSICALCGREVNESDYVYVGDTFIAGNDYPSIDHIKPLSKGGAHQWDNVQLAHRLCNSIKSDKPKKV